MNWNYFNTLGYVSVILWISMPLLWLIHSRMKPRRWLVHIALLLGIVALVLARINSNSHVDLIQQDQSELLAELQAEKDAELQAAIQSRGEDVANIQFAEDGADDFLDRAGMDESDLKYMDKVNEDAAPTWKNEKKSRSSGGDDSDLEDLIGAAEESQGVVTEELETATEATPILMNAKDKDMANRLDSLNLKTIRFLILLGIIFVIVDYLRRANIYREAYLPLPLPGSWINSVTPPSAIQERPAAPRRSMAEELAWMTKRGETFLYLTDDPDKAGQLPDELPKLGDNHWPTELIKVSDGERKLNNDFVFESLWYGRASFLVDSASSAKAILDDFKNRLEKRKTARAKTRHSVHIVWDLSEPIPESTMQIFSDLAEPTGFSLFLDHKATQIT